jgi:hypothetical protein
MGVHWGLWRGSGLGRTSTFQRYTSVNNLLRNDT